MGAIKTTIYFKYCYHRLLGHVRWAEKVGECWREGFVCWTTDVSVVSRIWELWYGHACFFITCPRGHPMNTGRDETGRWWMMMRMVFRNNWIGREMRNVRWKMVGKSVNGCGNSTILTRIMSMYEEILLLTNDCKMKIYFWLKTPCSLFKEHYYTTFEFLY